MIRFVSIRASYASLFSMYVFSFSLQADQLTEEQIAGKTFPPPFYWHMVSGVDSRGFPYPPPSLSTSGFILFPFMASPEIWSGHIPQIKGQVCCGGKRVTPGFKTKWLSNFLGLDVVFDERTLLCWRELVTAGIEEQGCVPCSVSMALTWSYSVIGCWFALSHFWPDIADSSSRWTCMHYFIGTWCSWSLYNMFPWCFG